jgi:hypothetical protein
MKEEIERIVEAHWQGRLPALFAALGDAHRQMDALLASQVARRGDTGEEGLERSLGGFGSEGLDLDALSGLLRRAGDGRDQAQPRHRRLERLATELAAAQLRLERTPPRSIFFELRPGPEVLEAFEAHVAPVCDALRLVRQARLEVRGRYDPGVHDPLFAQFNWRQLDSAETSLCPPFVVITEPRPDAGARLAAVLELVTSGRPLTVALLHSSWHAERVETGRAAALGSLDGLTLLFLALRNVFFLQTSAASPTPMAERIAQGLDSPRPTVLSVFAHGSDREDVVRRAAAALASRGFPHLLYDPERAPDFVGCLDLSDNPDPAAQWVTRHLTFADEDGKPGELEELFTFADYACTEPDLRGQFSALRPEQEKQAMPLVAYLDLGPSQRLARVPFVHELDPDQRLVRVVPSQAMLAYATDFLHLWTTLQELSGIGNRFVLAAERRLRQQFAAEMESALSEQKIHLVAESRARERIRLVEAVRNLVTRLTGITVPGTIPGVEAPLDAGPARASPAKGPSASDATAEPSSDVDAE